MTEQKQAPRWMLYFGGFIFVLALLAIGFRFWLSGRIRERITPAEVAAMDDFFEKDIEFPEAWRHVAPWSPEFVAASDRLVHEHADWMRTKPDLITTLTSPLFWHRLASSTPLSETELAELRAALDGSDDFHDALVETLAVPDYDLAGIDDRRKSLNLPQRIEVPWALSISIRSLSIGRARLLAEEGRWAEAFDAAMLSPRFARRGEAGTLSSHLVAAMRTPHALAGLAALALACPDAQVLREALRELEALEPEAFRASIAEHGPYLDLVGVLREYRRQGFPVDMESRAPAAHFWRHSQEVPEEYYKWRVARMPAGDPDRKALAEWASWGLKNGGAPGNVLLVRVLGFKRPVEEIFYMQERTFLGNLTSLESHALASARLLRLALAQRLAELDPASRPPLLDEGLVDPFDPAGAKLRWSASLGAHYSVGPDGKDDAAKTLVPVDELDRPGDIVLRAFHPAPSSAPAASASAPASSPSAVPDTSPVNRGAGGTSTEATAAAAASAVGQ